MLDILQVWKSTRNYSFDAIDKEFIIRHISNWSVLMFH